MTRHFVTATMTGLSMTPKGAENITLLAGGSLTAALSDVARNYTKMHGTPAAASFESSGPMR